MKILVSGCSYTWGSEMQDATDEIRSSNTWANQLGNNVTNVSLYSASNEWIARSVIDNYTDHELVVVMWSFPSRFLFEFAGTIAKIHGAKQNITPWQAETSWANIAAGLNDCDNDIVAIHKKKHKLARASGLTKFAHTWFKTCGHNEIQQLYTSWRSIATTAMWLKNRNIPAVFTYADSSLFSAALNTHPDLTPLNTLAQCVPWVDFDGQGFDEWAKNSNMPYGVSHPLEDAHAAAGKYLQQHIKELGIL